MREAVERSYYALCLALGRLLRGSRYAKAEVVDDRGEARVRKRRMFYAPLLVALGDPLVTLLDTGVRVLAQREWEERERELYRRLYDAPIRVEGNDALLLPVLEGQTLASLLENPDSDEATRTRAIRLAVDALIRLHDEGITHGDAMAENVMIDLDSGSAHWFDFETVHESSRSMTWRRADDLRALMTTCAGRVTPERLGETIRLILDAYDDARTIRLLASTFSSVLKRPLMFHLGQAPLSFQKFREIDRMLTSAS